MRRAVEAGAQLAISCDAHSLGDLDNMRYGVATAQRGWATPAHVLNAATSTACWTSSPQSADKHPPGAGRRGDRGYPRRVTPLDRAFFARPAAQVAPDLLGMLLVRADEGLVARIVETEAYHQDDPACHAHRGETARNAPLFGPPGHAYVYFTYGMHWCLNTATGRQGEGEGVLLRAAEPLEGHEVMRGRRPAARSDRDLLRGPARLAQAFGLDGAWSGVDLCAGVTSPLRLEADGARPEVAVGPRVGVAAAADLSWRFFIPASPWVSAYKRHPRAAQRTG